MLGNHAYLVVVVTLLGCGGEDDGPRSDAGGVPPSVDTGPACEDGDTVADDGGCRAAGVAPDRCGAGFEAADHGCTPILPDSPCPPGKMALPGEIVCREVSPCGTGTYGDIPTEPDTEYVDASYAGTSSDGTQAHPWTSIQDGIDAAAPGAIVGVAAGTYPGNVSISGKKIRLWGRCPALVEIHGSGTKPAAVAIADGASGTEIRALGVINGDNGVVISSSQAVVLDALWIHDTHGPGVMVVDDLGAPSVVAHGLLVEGVKSNAVVVQGGQFDVEASVIRDTKPTQDALGSGIYAQHGMHTARSNLTLKASLVEHTVQFGVQIISSDALIEATAIRDIQPSVSSHFYGRGIEIQPHPTNGERSTVTIRQSTIERSRDAGIAVEGSEATIEDAVARDTDSDASNQLTGAGVVAQLGLNGEPTSLTLRSSLVERNRDVGVFLSGALATLEGTLVRDMQPDAADQTGGRGIDVQDDQITGGRATATITACVVERSLEVGIFVLGSDADIQSTWVRDTRPSALDSSGYGIVAQRDGINDQRSNVTIAQSVADRSRGVGLFVFGSDAVLHDSFIRHTASNEGDGSLGDGAMASVDFDLSLANLTIVGTRIEASARAAISSFGATVSLQGSSLECNTIDLDGETVSSEYSFSDQGDNTCGCAGAASKCRVLTSSLQAPPPLPP